MTFPPLVSPPATPLDLEGVEVCYAKRSVGELVGHGRVRDAVSGGVLRPADMDKAVVGEVEALWVPVWRFEGSVDGFHVSLGTTTRGGRSRLTPRGGFQHKERTQYILARSGFAIDPSAKMRVPRADLIPLDEGTLEGLRIEPDIDRVTAQEQAELALKREGQPASALYAKVQVKFRDARLMFYPLYVVRYSYGGEAVDGGASMFFAALSGTSGKVVAAHHPSVLKSIGGKFRRLFGA
jgi:hypothetical protein